MQTIVRPKSTHKIDSTQVSYATTHFYLQHGSQVPMKSLKEQQMKISAQSRKNYGVASRTVQSQISRH